MSLDNFLIELETNMNRAAYENVATIVSLKLFLWLFVPIHANPPDDQHVLVSPLSGCSRQCNYNGLHRVYDYF